MICWLRRDDKEKANIEAKQCRQSPIPLHDPQFWSLSEKWSDATVGKPGHVGDDASAIEKPGGQTEQVGGPKSRMNWRHYILDLKLLNKKERERRKQTTLKEGVQPYFRRYINMAYQATTFSTSHLVQYNNHSSLCAITVKRARRGGVSPRSANEPRLVCPHGPRVFVAV